MSRIYSFDSILNFRDFGDYPTQDGGHVRPGHLFRSANFHRATDADIDKLAELPLGLRVDLRYAAERKKQPSRWPEALATKFADYPDSYNPDETLAPHEMFMKEQLHKPDDARDYMQTSYANRPNDPGFQHLVKSTLSFMADVGEPLVIHCAAGKDRTGTLAAIILGVLGVDDATIMDDYLMTMTAVDIDSFLEPAAAMMSKRYAREIEPENLRPMFGVEPSYLESSLQVIDDVVGYSEALGIKKTQLEAVKQNYLKC